MQINKDTPISQLYHSDDELMHYGVKGMRWGVRRYQNSDGTLTAAGKKRDARLSAKVREYSSEAYTQAAYASSSAAQRINGSRYLSKSDKYLKKAAKAASKMSDKGDSLQDNDYYRQAMYRNEQAGKSYVKRTQAEKAVTLVGSTAASVGAVYVSRMMGLPITMVYVTNGGDYKLKDTK